MQKEPKDKKRLPEEFYELQKVYTAQKTDEARLKVLAEMLNYIPPKDHRYNKVRSYTTHLMRLIRERIKKKERRDAAVELSRKFFKTDLFSIAFIGDANSGKTQLINELCGTDYPSTLMPFETKEPIISVFGHKGVKLRVVEVPSALKPNYVKILREADLIIVMPGDNKRYLEFIDDFAVETPVKVLDDYPKNKWSFLGLVVVKLRGEPLVLFKGAKLSDLDITKALVNDKEQKSSYLIKDGDVINVETDIKELIE